MGKASIISEAGSGLYTVDVLHDTAAADALLTRLNTALAATEARLAEETDPAALAALELRRTALTRRIARITAAADADFQTAAWCADLTEGLTGEVGTIEPGAETKNGINIRPGHDDGAAHRPARDGQATPFLTLPVADAMRNFAIMPAIQRWRPTYRYGTMSAIDVAANTCRVTLDPLASSIQDLDINPQLVLDEVPVDYMSCNAAAFEDGDDVIVQWDPYHADGQPTVIGFQDHPKPCGYALQLTSINGVDFPSGNNSYELRITQPIAQSVTHWKKGTYTEDFTVIGSGTVDDAGVAEIQMDAGIDPAYPLNVAIKNPLKWGYWTEDWRGSVPDRGFEWSPVDGDGWTTYPVGDLSGYDFLLDIVQWFATGIDLRSLAVTSFQTQSGETVNGYQIAVTGLKVLRKDHLSYLVTDMACDRGGETDPPEDLQDALDDVWPINYVGHDYELVTRVPRNFHLDEWVHDYLDLTATWQCFSSTATLSCSGIEDGLAYRAYFPDDLGAGSGRVGTKADPGILADRSGENLAYVESKAVIDVEQTYTCNWTWAEDLAGGICQPGEYAGDCGTAEAEVGENMLYEMVDLSADFI